MRYFLCLTYFTWHNVLQFYSCHSKRQNFGFCSFFGLFVCLFFQCWGLSQGLEQLGKSFTTWASALVLICCCLSCFIFGAAELNLGLCAYWALAVPLNCIPKVFLYLRQSLATIFVRVGLQFTIFLTLPPEQLGLWCAPLFLSQNYAFNDSIFNGPLFMYITVSLSIFLSMDS
jgi:hypothetical protein